ncbi:MAG: CPBP family intramembrane metalloprotease [Bacteroidetes bacterium]|nr:CPBP family intramembrane metalloprotease [Bacteroidota bacterium]
MEIDWKRAWYFISQILSILGFVFFGLLVSQFLALYIGQQAFKYDYNRASEIISNPALDASQAMFLRLFQMLTNFGTFALPVFMYLKVYKYPMMGTLKLRKFISPLQFIYISVFAFAALFGLSLLSDLNHNIPLPEKFKLAAEQMDEAQQKVISGMMFMPSLMHFLANILVVGVVAAFSEELMFRGLLQPLFKNWTKNIHLGILISAALFSAIHFDVSNFIPRMAIGVAFGYLFYWSGSLWITILAHFLNNSIEVFIYYFKDHNSWCNYFIEVKYFPVVWGLASLVVTLGILYLFKKKHESTANHDTV